MIVHQQEPQLLRGRHHAACAVTRRGHRSGQEIEKNSKRTAFVLAGAFHCDGAAVQVQQCFRNGQTEAETSESPGDRTFTLMERLENARLLFRIDADSGISDLKYEVLPFIIRANTDP